MVWEEIDTGSSGESKATSLHTANKVPCGVCGSLYMCGDKALRTLQQVEVLVLATQTWSVLA